MNTTARLQGRGPIVKTRDLTKTFRGTPPNPTMHWSQAVVRGVMGLVRRSPLRAVVDRVSLEIREGEFFGIIGSNGAGKTTFLKLLSGLLYPDAGEASVNGHDIRRDRTQLRRTVVIAKAQAWNGLGMLWQLTGRENLMFRARLAGLPTRLARERGDWVLERLGIAHKADEHSWNLSTGELQRLSLAMTFLVRTPLVILDEPTGHLDPRTARLVRDFASQDLNASNGQTVIYSTHYLEEADLMCNRVAVFHHGRMLACDTPAALKRTHVPEDILELRVHNYTPVIGERIKEKHGLTELLEHFEDVSLGQARLRPKWRAPGGDPEALRRSLEEEGVQDVVLRKAGPTLDDVYFHLTKEKVN